MVSKRFFLSPNATRWWDKFYCLCRSINRVYETRICIYKPRHIWPISRQVYIIKNDKEKNLIKNKPKLFGFPSPSRQVIIINNNEVNVIKNNEVNFIRNEKYYTNNEANLFVTPSLDETSIKYYANNQIKINQLVWNSFLSCNFNSHTGHINLYSILFYQTKSIGKVELQSKFGFI